MARLLRIDCSSRLQASQSRELADLVQAKWLAGHSRGEVLVRDLAKTPVPHIADATIAGFYTAADQLTPALRQATALSDALIAELVDADALLLSVPIYNFSIPSALKAYIDHVVRVGHTFGFDDQRGFFGMVANKPAYVAAAYGAAGYIGGNLAPLNFLEPYLKTLLGFLGISDVSFFSVEGTSIDPAALAATRRSAEAEIAERVH